MSLEPIPVIPQTPAQAVQRDQQADLATQLDERSPALQLVTLQQAIRQHREQIGDARHDADVDLWAHIES